MSSAATAAVTAARRAAQQARGQHAHCAQLLLGTTRSFSSVPSALAPSSGLSALLQQHMVPVQQLISLRRHLSIVPAAVPGGIPGTGGGSAERQTGAGGPTAGSAESSTGAAAGPAGGSAEASTGLGNPGQTAPAEAGTGLREPTDAPPVEQHKGASTAEDSAAAERTASPQEPEPSAGGGGGAQQPQRPASPGSSGGKQIEPGAATAAAGGSTPGEQPGSPNPEDPDEPVRAESKDDEGILSTMIHAIQESTGRMASRIVKRQIETGFSEKEFLESAKDAYWICNDLFAKRELETLQPMVSQKLLDAFRVTHDEYESKGLTFHLTKQEVDNATITEVSTIGKETIADLDPSLAALVPDAPKPPSVGGSGAVAAAAVGADQTAQTPVQPDWREKMKQFHPLDRLFLVIAVRFRGLQELETRRKDGGKVLSVLSDRRSHIWRFVRGPLSADNLPTRELDIQWKVLDIVR